MVIDLDLDIQKEGKAKLKHSKEYKALRITVDAAIETLHGTIDFVNELIQDVVDLARTMTSDAEIHTPFGTVVIPNPLDIPIPDVPEIPKLPFETLDEGLVYPISGDYKGIRKNAESCEEFDKGGTEIWSENLRHYSVACFLAFEGEASTAFAAHMAGYSIVAKAIGDIVHKGEKVFKQVAKMSEKIAVRVEKVLVKLLKIIIKISKRIASKFVPGVALVSLVWDLINIKSVIEEFKADIEFCADLVDNITDMKEEIEAWAQTQADRLKAFKEAATLINELPTVRLGKPLDQIPPVDPGATQESVDGNKPDFGKDGGDEAEAVDDALDNLEVS